MNGWWTAWRTEAALLPPGTPSYFAPIWPGTTREDLTTRAYLRERDGLSRLAEYLEAISMDGYRLGIYCQSVSVDKGPWFHPGATSSLYLLGVAGHWTVWLQGWDYWITGGTSGSTPGGLNRPKMLKNQIKACWLLWELLPGPLPICCWPPFLTGPGTGLYPLAAWPKSIST